MNEHETIRELLGLGAAGVLNREEQSRLDQHLRGCEACRKEWEMWSAYAGPLHALPQPAVPPFLVERTQALVLSRLEETAERRSSAIVLVSLSLLGWGMSVSLWLLARLWLGGAVMVLETNVLRLDLWALVSSGLVWACGATAAVVLAGRKSRDWRNAL